MPWGKILCYIRVFACKLGSLWRRQWDRNQIRSMHVESREKSRIVLREKSNYTGLTTVLANSRKGSGIRAACLSYSRLGQNEKVFALGHQSLSYSEKGMTVLCKQIFWEVSGNCRTSSYIIVRSQNVFSWRGTWVVHLSLRHKPISVLSSLD